MFSLIQHIYSRVIGTSPQHDDCNDDDYLEKELQILETEDTEYENFEKPEEIFKSDCFERTGTVTFLDENYGLIDGSTYFDKEFNIDLKLNDKVRYLARSGEDDSIQIIKLLYIVDSDWGDSTGDNFDIFNESAGIDEKHFDVKDYVMIGKVMRREGRLVLLKDNELKINLDCVESNFVPLSGDWLEIYSKVQWDDSKPCGSQAMQVIKVTKIKPLRTKIQKASVLMWDGENGILDQSIYFNKAACIDAYNPSVGSSVIVEAVESDQGECCWRAISLISDKNVENIIGDSSMVNSSTKQLEEDKELIITEDLSFGNINFVDEKRFLKMELLNKSKNTYKILKWKLSKSRDDSQIKVNPVLFKVLHLHPGQTFCFNVTAKPKYLGYSKESITFFFEGFEIERWITMNVVSVNTESNAGNAVNMPFDNKPSRETMKNYINNSNKRFVPGQKLKRSPNFVPVKLGLFNIPRNLWDLMLEDHNESVYCKEFDIIVERLEKSIPCLTVSLTANNYKDRWHTLLYLEEIQATITFRCYDIPKAFLRPIDEYLTVEFKGLGEKRPSLMCGDRAVAKVLWDENQPNYEGYIHQIRGDTVFIKFNRMFHEMYTGYDVALEFSFTRGVYRRYHQAVNLALTNLGPEILFPSSIRIAKEHRNVNVERWYKNDLNTLQKQAVQFILNGTTRPMPYVVFGPPGTGKTVTVVEAILQIFTLCPDSRILIATPSNSSANLITERLIDYGNITSGSIIRIIAHYLVESATIPEKIRPYCATLDMATERTAACNQTLDDNGINLCCRSTFIGRHRITIGTCAALGVLALMELPKGHFSHVVIDEAGQATEPEIMIPLTFLDKTSGQVILAGDPMQLGPVVMSKFTNLFGLGESFLSRLLSRFPYQKDTESFKHVGYDNRLITQLTYNYRSVPDVLNLPSKMFYSDSLVPQIESNEGWQKDMIQAIADIIPNASEPRGGIFFWGIRGTNLRAEESPSWYNPQEAGMILFHICKLYKRDFTPDQIGIITPYIAQVRYLRKIFDSSGVEQPKIGSVEDFQGQERPIIILSTVRSSEGLLEEDKKFALGFVNSPKRLNVALTRAQVAVFVFGNPHLLGNDHLWGQVIKYSISCNNYCGCDLPAHLQNNLT